MSASTFVAALGLRGTRSGGAAAVDRSADGLVDGVVGALCSADEKGALLVVVDPLTVAGAIAALYILPRLARRVAPELLRALVVLPARDAPPDAAMGAHWT